MRIGARCARTRGFREHVPIAAGRLALLISPKALVPEYLLFSVRCHGYQTVLLPPSDLFPELRRRHGIHMRTATLLLLIVTAGMTQVQPERTRALFNLSTPQGGPFPSNRFTVLDPAQLTGRRMNLPLPNCDARPSDCADLRVVNELDGFNIQPRLSIPFDGPINPGTVTGRTIFLLRLGSTVDPEGPIGTVVGLNQLVWNPPTNTLYAESDELLDQHTLYALIVTAGVLDPGGQPVLAGQEFLRFGRNRDSLEKSAPKQ